MNNLSHRITDMNLVLRGRPTVYKHCSNCDTIGRYYNELKKEHAALQMRAFDLNKQLEQARAMTAILLSHKGLRVER